MSAKNIEVNTGVLRNDVDVIATELDKILKNADQLSAILGELEGMWEGNAKQAFSAAVRDDLGRLRELVKAIQDLTQRTSDARQEYDKCENAVSQIVSSIRV